MSDSVKINIRRFIKSKTHKEGDVVIEITTSPYDIPESVVPSVLDDQKRFRLQFHYIGADEPTHEQVTDHVRIRVGKESGRVYEMEIDIEGLVRETIAQQLIEKASGAVKSLQRLGHPSNYDVIKNVLVERGADLFASASA